MIVAIGAIVMDNMSATLALPAIARHFAIEDARSIWVINTYQLVLICCILPIAAIAERIGYRKVYIVGLVMFAIMSVCSASAPTFELLVLSRGLQAVATACVFSVNLALIRTIFPESKLGGALGINATAGAIATAAGPSIAGFLIDHASWQWIFALGIPFTVAAAIVSCVALPASPGKDRKFDTISSILSALTFGGLLMGISSIGHQWALEVSITLLVTGVVSGFILVIRLKGAMDPLLPVDLLAIPAFAVSALASILAFTAQMIAFVSLPFHMQATLQLTAAETGLAFSSWPLAMACTAAVSGMLADRLPQRLLSAIGLLTLALGLGLLAGLDAGSSFVDIAARLAICGVGFALFLSPNNRILLSSAPKSRASAAGGLLGTARLLGQALGTALATFAVMTNGGDASYALWGAMGIAFLAALVATSHRDRFRT